MAPVRVEVLNFKLLVAPTELEPVKVSALAFELSVSKFVMMTPEARNVRNPVRFTLL